MIRRYHDGTKHQYHRFARSLGYLDWASQPNPFRSFDGAPAAALPPRPDAALAPAADAIGHILRDALGLTAWKQFGRSRWSLRANPSSGNLHPTEAYVVTRSGVFHYAADRHVLECRCNLDGPVDSDTVLVALTSIHWREAWKYGERAFRYCQHDLGHAIAAIRIAASLQEFSATLLPEWSSADIAAVTGIDRDEDYVEAEREEPGCLIEVARRRSTVSRQPRLVVEAARAARWSGRANQLSEDHVQWSFIDEIAEATRDPGRALAAAGTDASTEMLYSSALVRQRRSAVALDGRSSIAADRFFAMMTAIMPQHAPFDALWWSARIHCALFVHRVEGLEAGLYLLLRERASGERLTASLGRAFAMESAHATLPLVRLVPGDCRALARRVSCDQDIAADGFFSLGMIADFDRSLEEFGPSFYRHLFWESGVVGQSLYLEAEAAGVRGTGIGCFYDDGVHEVLGLSGHAFQSLYHFTVGVPVDDARLMTAPGYDWEA